MICLNFTYPISLNNMFPTVGGGRRVVSKEYSAWREANGWEIQATKPGRIGGPVYIEIEVEKRRQGDIDNLPKCIFDLLVTHNVIDGDGPGVIRDFRIKNTNPNVRGALVSIYPLSEAA